MLYTSCMKKTLHIVFYSAAILIASIATLTIWLSSIQTRRLHQEYGAEAIRALAFDAASSFPIVEDNLNLHISFWPRPETPCVFTTNVMQVHGNGSIVGWENWPRGNVPTCADFYSSKSIVYDAETTIPRNCLPAYVIYDQGGAAQSFVAFAADGTDTSALNSMHLSTERRNRLARFGTPTDYFYTNTFIRGGGLEGVSITLQETESCDGFSLFRFTTEVGDIRTLRRSLEAEGYSVGMN